MEFSKEQIEKAKNCKTLDEFKNLAKEEGFSFKDEEAKALFEVTRSGELTDEEVSTVAGGGKGEKWVEVYYKDKESQCPFCRQYHFMKICYPYER